jgi:hypothetical protein
VYLSRSVEISGVRAQGLLAMGLRAVSCGASRDKKEEVVEVSLKVHR